MATGAGTPARVDEETITRLRSSLLRLARSLRTMSADEGLSPAQSSLLATLVRGGPARAGDLAAAEALNPTMCSRVLGHLEAEGLIERSCAEDDRRATVVRATAAGRRRVASLRARRGAALRARLESLPPHLAADLLRALPAIEALAAAPRP